MRRVTRPPQWRNYRVCSALWSLPDVHIVVLSDLHACTPWTPLEWIDAIIDRVMAAAPDLIVLPGDFLIKGLLGARPLPIEQIAACLSRLRAPLGVYASLGNHDWKDCAEAHANGYVETSVTRALADAGLPVLSNDAVVLPNGAWLVGFDTQQGIGTVAAPDARHDPARAFAKVPEGASTILMAHEPDWFLDQTEGHAPPVALQVSGHTHGGQVSLLGWRPVTASRYGGKLVRGLHARGERHLVVSAGLGYTTLPLRIGVPTEIVSVRLGSRPQA